MFYGGVEEPVVGHRVLLGGPPAYRPGEGNLVLLAQLHEGERPRSVRAFAPGPRDVKVDGDASSGAVPPRIPDLRAGWLEPYPHPSQRRPGERPAGGKERGLRRLERERLCRPL